MTADFGSRLRAQRERRGITLDAIAHSTKITRSLLADLERNDLSRWPDGLLRRAFLRQYASAIGLPENTILQECCAMAPDAGGRRPPLSSRASPDALGPLRLTLAGNPASMPRLRPGRALEAAATVALVLAVGGLITLSTGMPFWTVSGVLALVWYPISHAVFGNDSPLRVRRRASRRALATELDTLVVSEALHGGGEDRTGMSPIETADQHLWTPASPSVH